MYAAAWPLLGYAALLAVVAAAVAAGFAAACSVAADALLLLLSPLVAVYCATALLHRVQLRCLQATWRLIRGRQKVRQGAAMQTVPWCVAVF